MEEYWNLNMFDISILCRTYEIRKKFNKPLAERKNKIVTFGKDAQLLKITICLLPCEIPIGIYQNVIERQTPRENYDSNIAKHMANLIHNGEPNPQNDF